MTRGQGISDLVVIAAIAGAHGVRGNVRVRSFAANAEDCFSYGPLLDKSGQAILDPKHFHSAKDHFVVTPKAPRQKEEWDALKRTLLYVPSSALPETEEDEFYIRELAGLDVYIGGEQAAGKVKAVHNFGAGDIIEITLADTPKPVMVPFTVEDVPVVDILKQRIVVATLDLWMTEDEARGKG